MGPVMKLLKIVVRGAECSECAFFVNFCLTEDCQRYLQLNMHIQLKIFF